MFKLIKQIPNPYFFIILVALMSFDIYEDFQRGTTSGHIYLEAAILVSVLVILTINIIKIFRIESELSTLKNEVHQYIDTKINDWKLSKAEKDIFWLIVKGYSHNEIANIRSVSIRTVESQSKNIYLKLNCKNKHEMMSLVLDELIDKN